MPKENDVSQMSLHKEEAEVLGKMKPVDSSDRFQQLISLLSFGQYLTHKHQFIEQTIKDDKKPPSNEKLQVLTSSFRAPQSTALTTIKSTSESLLKNFAEEYARLKNTNEFLIPVREHINSRTGFWHSFVAHVFAAFAYSLFVASIVFIATVASPDSKFSKAFKILFVEENPTITTQTHDGSNERSKNDAHMSIMGKAMDQYQTVPVNGLNSRMRTNENLGRAKSLQQPK